MLMGKLSSCLGRRVIIRNKGWLLLYSGNAYFVQHIHRFNFLAYGDYVHNVVMPTMLVEQQRVSQTLTKLDYLLQSLPDCKNVDKRTSWHKRDELSQAPREM
jgi:hypothetical protein